MLSPCTLRWLAPRAEAEAETSAAGLASECEGLAAVGATGPDEGREWRAAANRGEQPPRFDAIHRGAVVRAIIWRLGLRQRVEAHEPRGIALRVSVRRSCPVARLVGQSGHGARRGSPKQ